MAASIGVVSLPYGVEVESPNYSANVVEHQIPLGASVLQDVGTSATNLRITTTVNKTTLESLVEQFNAIRMVSFDVDDTGKGDTAAYGIFMTNIAVNRTSATPTLYRLTINAYKLDFDVDTVRYALFDDYSLAASTQVTSDDTDEQTDDYMVGLTLKSDKDVSFWIQYSDDGISWSDHPSDLSYDLDLQKRDVQLNNLTGYLRVVALNNEASGNATINAIMFLSKQVI
jgi:hypothetical protein